MFDRVQAEEIGQIFPVFRFPKMTLSVEEAADELNISKPTAYKLVKEPGFPVFKIGDRTLVSRAGLQRWIDMKCDPLPVQPCEPLPAV